MVRDVELVSYLPPFMREYKEPVETLSAENQEFHIIWEAADKVFYNKFISTADAYGISKFESMLGIRPSANESLETRRQRVQSRWLNKIPYTLRVLLQRLGALCVDSGFEVTGNFEEYQIRVETSLELYGQLWELKTMLEDMIPCNMVITVKNEISLHSNVNPNVGIAGVMIPIYSTERGR